MFRRKTILKRFHENEVQTLLNDKDVALTSILGRGSEGNHVHADEV